MIAHLLGEQLLDPDDAQAAPPDARDQACAARLVNRYREKQQTRLAALAGRFSKGHRLREYRRQLAQGELLDHHSASRLELEVCSDIEARRTQDRLRLAYLQRREGEARQRARAHGLASYLLHGSSDAKAQVDHEWLRVCERCREIAYPGEHQQFGYGFHPPPRQCHYCGNTDTRARGMGATGRQSSRPLSQPPRRPTCVRPRSMAS